MVRPARRRDRRTWPLETGLGKAEERHFSEDARKRTLMLPCDALCAQLLEGFRRGDLSGKEQASAFLDASPTFHRESAHRTAATCQLASASASCLGVSNTALPGRCADRGVRRAADFMNFIMDLHVDNSSRYKIENVRPSVDKVWAALGNQKNSSKE